MSVEDLSTINAAYNGNALFYVSMFPYLPSSCQYVMSQYSFSYTNDGWYNNTGAPYDWNGYIVQPNTMFGPWLVASKYFKDKRRAATDGAYFGKPDLSLKVY